MHAVGLEELEEISRRIALAIVGASGVDCSSVALDMTNSPPSSIPATSAPIAQRGKAKQKRADLRLVGLGLVVTRRRDPLTWHAYPATSRRHPVPRHGRRAGRRHARSAPQRPAAAEMTVVFDAGQNSGANFAHLAGTGLRYVGSVPASDCAGRPGCPPAPAPSSMRTASGR